MSAVFRAKYVVILQAGRELPLLVPSASGYRLAEIAKLGHPVSAGACELHTLGNGDLGFTVAGGSESLGLTVRFQKDPGVLAEHFLLS